MHCKNSAEAMFQLSDRWSAVKQISPGTRNFTLPLKRFVLYKLLTSKKNKKAKLLSKTTWLFHGGR